MFATREDGTNQLLMMMWHCCIIALFFQHAYIHLQLSQNVSKIEHQRFGSKISSYTEIIIDDVSRIINQNSQQVQHCPQMKMLPSDI